MSLLTRQNQGRYDVALGGLVVALGFAIPISSAADNILLAAILALWLMSSHYGLGWTLVRGCAVVQVILALVAWRLFGALYSDASLREIGSSIHDTLRMLWIPVLMTVFRSDRVRSRALTAFLAAMGLTLVLSYAVACDLIGPQPWLKGNKLEPVVFKLHITHGFLMAYAAFILLVLARYAHSPRSRSLFFAVAIAAAFNVLFMIGGKTGHLILVVLLIFFLFTFFQWKGLLLAATLVIFIGAMAWIHGDNVLYVRTAEMIDQLRQWEPGKAHIGSVNTRLDFYLNTWHVIASHPIFGVGAGGFASAYAKVVAGTTMPSTMNPHNEYLIIAAEFGIIGLAILIAVFVTLWRSAATLPEQSDRMLARGLIIAFALASMVTSTIIDHTEGLLLCWFTALLYSSSRTADQLNETLDGRRT